MLRFPILSGPLRGVRWRLDGGGKVLRVLSGTYEPEQTRRALELVRRGATVFDVGAHIGYYTLLFSRLAGPGGRVVAFEPSPRNLPVLRWHVARNGCANVRVEAAAVSAETGSARFTADTGSGTGRLAESGTVEVRTIRLDDYVDAGGPMPDVLKIDVEGAELDVLLGLSDDGWRKVRQIVLEGHDKEGRLNELVRLIESHGMKIGTIGKPADTEALGLANFMLTAARA